jgi:hypothetical protein
MSGSIRTAVLGILAGTAASAPLACASATLSPASVSVWRSPAYAGSTRRTPQAYVDSLNGGRRTRSAPVGIDPLAHRALDLRRSNRIYILVLERRYKRWLLLDPRVATQPAASSSFGRNTGPSAVVLRAWPRGTAANSTWLIQN